MVNDSPLPAQSKPIMAVNEIFWILTFDRLLGQTKLKLFHLECYLKK
jgi:hypothetical protein